jgi:site-specific DNA recombinase
MSVASYVRVSTAHQVQQQTVEQQLTRLQSYAEQQGWSWEAMVVFRDDGYSGASLQRPGLDQLRDQVQTGKVSTVLITAPDPNNKLANSWRSASRVHCAPMCVNTGEHGCRCE